MGGAYTALASDGSATYYNPAGLVGGLGTGLALSLPLYGYIDRVIPRALSLPPLVARLTSRTFVSVPSTFVLSQRFGKPDEHGILPDAVAWSILVPYYTTYNGQSSVSDSVTSRVESVQNQDQTLWIGPSYAHRVNAKVGIGLSMFLATARTRRRRKLGPAQQIGDSQSGSIQESSDPVGLAAF